MQTSDHLAREMLAYCRLIIREALRHRRQGWQEYDRTFRCQWEINPSVASSLELFVTRSTGCHNTRTEAGTRYILLTVLRQQPLEHAVCFGESASARNSITNFTTGDEHPTLSSSPPLSAASTCVHFLEQGACMFPGWCNFHTTAQPVPWHTEPRIVLTPRKNLYTGVAGDMGRGRVTGSHLS